VIIGYLTYTNDTGYAIRCETCIEPYRRMGAYSTQGRGCWPIQVPSSIYWLLLTCCWCGQFLTSPETGLQAPTLDQEFLDHAPDPAELGLKSFWGESDIRTSPYVRFFTTRRS
jgi:hypothetical protein